MARVLWIAGVGLILIGATWWLARRSEPALEPREAPSAPVDTIRVADGSEESVEDQAPERTPDILFVGTPPEVVDRMLQLAKLRQGDVLYDLGCGDGRIVVTAARRYGVRAVGVELDPRLVRQARENARRSGVEHLVTIRQEDIFVTDLDGADVVTTYLLPRLNVQLKPRLARLKAGTRVLSHAFDMAGAVPNSVTMVHCRDGIERKVYLWVVPWRTTDD